MPKPYELLPTFRAMLRRIRVGWSAHVGGDVVTGDKYVFMSPSEPVKPAELPPDVAHFVGRQRLLAQLDTLVDDDLTPPAVPRGAVIHGMPGVGKTAVALRWGHSLLARELYPDGHLFLDLRGYSRQPPVSPREALGQLLRHLGMHEKTIPPAEDEQKALYRSLLAERELLIMLDNAASTEQVNPLLPGTANCLVIVTSRDKLDGLVVDGLRPFEVQPLGPDEALAYIGGVVGRERLGAELDAARELARQCAHLPLALRVATAKLAGRPDERLEAAASELAEGDRLARLSLADDPDRAVLPAFELSYGALTRELRRAFVLLCLVEGPDFTTDAAAALLGIPVADARELIRSLERVHLIDRIEADRYGIHDLLREYGRQPRKTDTPSAGKEAIRRLLAYYLGQAVTAGRSLGRYRRTIKHDDPAYHRGGTDVITRNAALDWLERERANLVAAVRQAFHQELNWLTWELADALYDFLTFRRYSQENEEVHDLGLRAARRAGHFRAEFFMLHHLARSHHQRRAHEHAYSYADQALTLSRRHDDLRGEADSRTILARIRHAQGGHKEALEFAASSRRLWREVRDKHGEAEAHLTVGLIRWRASEYDAALVAAIWALDIHQQIGDRHGEAECLDLMAGAFRRIGDYEKAVNHAESALRIRQEIGDQYGESTTLLNLARVLRHLRRFDEAHDRAKIALEIRREMGDLGGEALATLARIYRSMGKFKIASVYANQALAVAREMSDRYDQAYALHNLAQIHRARRHPGTALEYAEAALDAAAGILDPYGQARRLHAIGVILIDLNRPAEALDRLNEASQIEHQIGDPLSAIRTMEIIVKIHRRLGHDEEADRIAAKADALRKERWLLWDHDDGSQ